MSEKAHNIRDEKATAKKYELFLKSVASNYGSATSSMAASVHEGRRKTSKSPPHAAKKEREKQKIAINEKASNIKTQLQQKLRVSMRHNNSQKSRTGKLGGPGHRGDGSDVDSLQELDEIPTITHPRSFFVDDYKDKSILIIPSKEQMQRLLFKSIENMV